LNNGQERFDSMKLNLVLALLAVSGANAAAQPTAFCPYGQTCQKSNPVPFPVINPVRGLSNILTDPSHRDQQLPPGWNYAPIATPPPVLPPGMTLPESTPPANTP
jgi:hypothetical protein